MIVPILGCFGDLSMIMSSKHLPHCFYYLLVLPGKKLITNKEKTAMLIPDHPVPSTELQALSFRCGNRPDGCAISIFWPLVSLWNKAGQQGFLKACLERERERLDGILNKNDRLCFKLNKNKLSEEYIEVACGCLWKDSFLFVYLWIKEER